MRRAGSQVSCTSIHRSSPNKSAALSNSALDSSGAKSLYSGPVVVFGFAHHTPSFPPLTRQFLLVLATVFFSGGWL